MESHTLNTKNFIGKIFFRRNYFFAEIYSAEFISAEMSSTKTFSTEILSTEIVVLPNFLCIFHVSEHSRYSIRVLKNRASAYYGNPRRIFFPPKIISKNFKNFCRIFFRRNFSAEFFFRRNFWCLMYLLSELNR